jgi:hypothetical protein
LAKTGLFEFCCFDVYRLLAGDLAGSIGIAVARRLAAGVPIVMKSLVARRHDPG